MSVRPSVRVLVLCIGLSLRAAAGYALTESSLLGVNSPDVAKDSAQLNATEHDSSSSTERQLHALSEQFPDLDLPGPKALEKMTAVELLEHIADPEAFNEVADSGREEPKAGSEGGANGTAGSGGSHRRRRNCGQGGRRRRNLEDCIATGCCTAFRRRRLLCPTTGYSSTNCVTREVYDISR